MFPTTSLGKLVATIAMVCGLLVLALPISIIGTNFLVCYQKSEDRKRRAKLRDEAEARAFTEFQEARLEAEKDELAAKLAALKLAGKVPWFTKRLNPEKASGLRRSVSLKLITNLTKTPSITEGSVEAAVKNKGKLTLEKLSMQRSTKSGSSSSGSITKDLLEGHMSLSGLKKKARLTPSFLYDASTAVFDALHPRALTGVSEIDRNNELLYRSIPVAPRSPISQLFGSTPSSARSFESFKKSFDSGNSAGGESLGGLSEIALKAKYSDMLSAAQDLIVCMQVTRQRCLTLMHGARPPQRA